MESSFPDLFTDLSFDTSFPAVAPSITRKDSLDWLDPGFCLTPIDDGLEELGSLLFGATNPAGSNDVLLADEFLAHPQPDQQPVSIPAPSPQDDDLLANASRAEQLRERNRKAQQATRQRKRAHEDEQQARAEELTQAIQAAKLAAAAGHARCASLKTRVGKATSALHAVHAELQRLQALPPAHSSGYQLASQSPSPFDCGAPVEPGSHFRQTEVVPAPARSTDAHGATSERADPGPSKPCPIFVSTRHTGPGTRRFKRSARISAGLVNRGKRCTLAQLASFRAEVAKRMRCNVDEICWLLDATCNPETGGSPMTSHLGTPDCAAKLALCWLCTQIEITALLTIIKIQERTRDAYCTDVNCYNTTPAQFGDGWGSARADPFAPTQLSNRSFNEPSRFSLAHDILGTSSWSQSSGVARDRPPAQRPPTSVHFMTDVLRGASDGRHGGAALPAPLHAGKGAMGGTGHAHIPNFQAQDHLEALASCLFSRLLRKYTCQMHQPDALNLCKRLLTMSEVFEPADRATRDSSSGNPVVPSDFTIGISKALKAVATHVMMELNAHPSAPNKPPNKDAADAELARLQHTLDSVNAEWCLTFNLTMMDAPHIVRAMSLKMSPAAISYVKFEEYNVRAFSYLAMSMEQKQELAQIWNMYTKQAEQLASQRNYLAAQLAALPSTSDLDADDLFTLFFPTAAHKHSPLSLWTRPAAASTWGTPFNPTGASHLGLNSQSSFGRNHWLQKLIGVSLDATDAAARTLTGLRDIQTRDVELHLWFLELVSNVLSSKQFATLTASMMPFVADAFRISGMAATDVTQQRLFGRITTCAVVQPPGYGRPTAVANYPALQSFTPH